MRIPGEVIIHPAGGDRWIVWNVLTQRALGLDTVGLGMMQRAAAGEPADGARARVWDIAHFASYAGLFADPTRFLRGEDDWPAARICDALALEASLREQHLLIADDAEYEAFLAPKTSLLDRRHLGNFHQQLGQHLLLQRREHPDTWWLDQKFTEDRTELGDNLYRAVQRPFVERLASERFREGHRVVDLGCGIGQYTRLMGQNGAQVLGVDPNPAFLETAAAAPANVTFHEADIGAPGALDWIESGSVDFVYMSDVLLFYFVPPDPSMSRELSVLLADLRRILKPDGRFMSLEPHGTYFLRPRLGAVDRPYTVVTEHRERLFNVVPCFGDMARAMMQEGWALVGYEELYTDPDRDGGTPRDRAFAGRFPLWWFWEWTPLRSAS